MSSCRRCSLEHSALHGTFSSSYLLRMEHVTCQQTEQTHSEEANRSAQLLQDFTLSSSREHFCDVFNPAQPQPSGMEQLNVAAIVAQAQHLQGWCAQLELQLQAKDIGASPVASPPAQSRTCVASLPCPGC